MNNDATDRTNHLHGVTGTSAGQPVPTRRWALLTAGIAALLLTQNPLPAWARGRTAAATATPAAHAATNQEQLAVTLNQSRVIRLRAQAARVSVANPEVADLLVIDPSQVYVVGKRLGTTNLVLWDGRDRVTGTIGLEVTPDLDLLKTRLHEVMPGERVQVRSAQGSIVVSGAVSSPERAGAAVQLAQSFADSAAGDDKEKAKVLNLIQVGGSQQVMLEVRVAEISRNLVKRLDINFTGFYNGGSVRIGTAGSGTSFPDADLTHWIYNPTTGQATRETGRLPVFPESAGQWGPAINEVAPGKTVVQDKALFLQSLSGNFLFNLVIDAAKNQGLARILAEPNLTTLSGQEAKFLAGGEFPIPVPQSFGTTTIDYKDFGVGLQFLPVVLDSGVISMKVNVTVSDLTTQNSLSLPTAANGGRGAFFVPALTKRTANATVDVRTGQTIAIAGLINESLRENVDKFPGLGEIPVLGMLFRSQEFIKGQTELVIFVTPRLARSYSPDLVKLPTDSFVEPTDLEFYLMGRTQGRRYKPSDAAAGSAPAGTLGPDKSGAEGAFGHDL